MARSLRRWAQSFPFPSVPKAASLAAGLEDLALAEDALLPKAARDLKTTPIEMSPEGDYEPSVDLRVGPYSHFMRACHEIDTDLWLQKQLEGFPPLRNLGYGTFGVARLMRSRRTGELVAVKFLPRGCLVNDYVEREIMNHRSLQHPHIIAFKEAFLTPTHLAIVMEYAIGGELFDYLNRVQRFTENEARYFFQQLISGLEHCHKQGICHRDLKLENLLLDGSKAPRLKICDFGYSKHKRFDSGPKSVVGTGAYIAPEVIISRTATAASDTYDGQAADVWSAAVVLYLLLVGRYPFEDPANPSSFELTIRRIMAARYEVPAALGLSPDCCDLLACMLQPAPAHRITLPAIKRHPFFLRNLPRELQEVMAGEGAPLQSRQQTPAQGLRQLQGVIQEARLVVPAPAVVATAAVGAHVPQLPPAALQKA